jgi:ABC-type transporter Mla subunit MlaD
VRLAGIDIGTVEDIRFSDDLETKHVIVVLGISDRYMDRIRADSVAQMNTKGLLGDMMINISLGSADRAQLRDGDQIRSKEVEGIAQIISSVESAVSTVKELTAVVDERIRLVLTEDLGRDVGRIARSMANVMEGVERGSGLAHALIYDPKIAASGSIARRGAPNACSRRSSSAAARGWSASSRARPASSHSCSTRSAKGTASCTR